jgi:hypothetical protein
MSVEELIEEKLMQLMKLIGNLEQTPLGADELRRRIQAFGDCKRIEGETTDSFYGRLRHWLDRNFPQSKAARRALRQTCE